MKALLLSLSMTVATFPASAGELPAEIASASEAMQHFDQRASVRLLNVWATWCAPCVVEMADLQRLETDLGPQGLDIVGISMDDLIPGDRLATRSRVARFLSSREITFVNVYFTGKPHEIVEELKLEGEIPVTLVYDRHGNELMRVTGPIKLNEVEPRLRAFLDAENR